MSQTMTKAELEAAYEKLQKSHDSLQKRYDSLKASKAAANADGVDGSPSTLSDECCLDDCLDPRLIVPCIGQLRNPMTNAPYSDGEFEAYAPEFVKQAFRMAELVVTEATDRREAHEARLAAEADAAADRAEETSPELTHSS